MSSSDPAAPPPPSEATEEASVTRRVDIDAPPEDVFDAIATEEGRDRWLDADPSREIHVETSDPAGRIVWWWWSVDGPATRVEFVVAPRPGGSRVVVTETVPRLPVALLGLAPGAARLRPLPLVSLAHAFAAVPA